MKQDWPKNALEHIVSDLCSDSRLYKRNKFSFSCTLSFPSLFWGLCTEVKDSGPPLCCWWHLSLRVTLPLGPGIHPPLWAISTVWTFKLLIFLTRHSYSASIFSAVNSKAISTSPTLLSVQRLADVSDQKRTFGDLRLNFLLGWERDKRTGLIWIALIWFPKREIPFHLMHPYRPKQCSCAAELTLEDTAELHRGASCMGLPMDGLSHCCSPTGHKRCCFSPWHRSEVITGSSMRRKRVVSVKT